MKRLLVAVGLALLLYGSALVFLAFDRTSHSVSDTLRPFVVAIPPVWAVYLAAARVVLRS